MIKKDKALNHRSYFPIWSVMPVLLFIGFFFHSHYHTAKNNNQHLAFIGEQISGFFEASDDPVSFQYSVVKTQLSKYRKRYKHVNDSALGYIPFAKRIAKQYTFPFSVPAYQKPYFSSALHTFLYRFACF